MKKTLWMLGVAVAALTSCTQSEVLDVPKNRKVTFDTFVKKQTRATNDVEDGSGKPFKKFYVYVAKGELDNNSLLTNSTNIADGEAVYGGKGNWDYATTMYWSENKTFRFAAYANGNATEASDDNSALLNNVVFSDGTTSDAKDWGLTISDYEVGNKDLVVAIPEEQTINDINSAPIEIGLTFKHVLSKIIFEFRYPNQSSGNMKVVPFGFDASKSGDCVTTFKGTEGANIDQIQTTWTPDNYIVDNHNDYNFFPDGSNTWSSDKISSECYVIPQANMVKNNGTITSQIIVPNITIQTLSNSSEVLDERVFLNVSLGIDGHEQWLPGFVYRYVAVVTPGAHEINFTTSVTTWADDNNRNQTITSGSN